MEPEGPFLTRALIARTGRNQLLAPRGPVSSPPSDPLPLQDTTCWCLVKAWVKGVGGVRCEEHDKDPGGFTPPGQLIDDSSTKYNQVRPDHNPWQV